RRDLHARRRHCARFHQPGERRHGGRQLRHSSPPRLLHVWRVEALWLRRSQPARSGLGPVLHQDQDRYRALAVGHQGRRRVRHSDHALIKRTWPCADSIAVGIARNASSAPKPSAIAPPSIAGRTPATIASALDGSLPACMAKRPPSSATPIVAPTMRAVLMTLEAVPE